MKKILVLAFFCASGSYLGARYVSHKSVSTDVELLGGKEFAHTQTNDMGTVHEDFSIDRVPVQKDDFYQAWESAYLSDAHKERQDRFDKQRARFEFVNESQAALLEKSIKKTTFTSKQMLQSLSHETLKPYLKFDNNIKSAQHLSEMKQALDESEKSVKKMSKDYDLQGLKDFLKQIESWPDHLETCFKNSVNSAVGQCDDTASLKELLALMSVV
jgi:heme oxygenase